jgi:hypothetical protein
VTPVGNGAIASPCTSVCRIDRATGLCAGCYRTLDEIAAWAESSPRQKQAVLATLATRRAQFGAAIAARHATEDESDGER